MLQEKKNVATSDRATVVTVQREDVGPLTRSDVVTTGRDDSRGGGRGEVLTSARCHVNTASRTLDVLRMVGSMVCDAYMGNLHHAMHGALTAIAGVELVYENKRKS